MRRTQCKARQRGLSLLEVLITMLMTAVGLLGMAQLIAKTGGANLESAQRARASVLLEDMTERILATRTGEWMAVNGLTVGDLADACTSLSASAKGQACEWGRLLAGAHEGGVGALPMRGCFEVSNAGRTIRLTIAWTAPNPAPAPADPCGFGELTSSGKDEHRRTVSTIVQLPVLSSGGLGTVAE